MKYTETYRNALAIQRLVVADAKATDCEPKVRCLLARAFSELELLKLRLRMKPAPKPIDVSGLTNGKHQKQPRSSFTESAGPVVVPSVPKPVEPGPTNTTS